MVSDGLSMASAGIGYAAVWPKPNIAATSRKVVKASLLPAAIESLPVRQRNVVIWRYFEERYFEEIADLLGVQLSTARSLLRHGLNNLRKAIGSTDCFSKDAGSKP